MYMIYLYRRQNIVMVDSNWYLVNNFDIIINQNMLHSQYLQLDIHNLLRNFKINYNLRDLVDTKLMGEINKLLILVDIIINNNNTNINILFMEMNLQLNTLGIFSFHILYFIDTYMIMLCRYLIKY